MKFPCKFVLSFNQLLGIILASIGAGMLIMSIISWWGCIIAIILIIVGLILIFNS